MISRITYLLLVIFLISLDNPVSAQLDSLYTQQWNRDPVLNLNTTISAQRQIITAEQIRLSGYTQLSEVFHLIDGWHINLKEEPPRQLQSNGTGFYTQQNWVLMLNGQRIEMNRSPGLDVNQLGISVYDIERIEIVNSNGIYLSEFTQNGLIHIITKKNTRNGIHINTFAGSTTGNPFNQPPPAITMYPQMNVATISTGYTLNRFHLNISASYQNGILGKREPQIIPRMEMQYAGKKITHQIQTKSITTKSPLSILSYLGLWKLNNNHSLRLSTSISQTDDFVFYQQSEQVDANLQYRFISPSLKGNLIWQTGVAMTSTAFNNTLPLYPGDIFIPKLNTSINIPVTRKANLFSDVQVSFCNTKVAPKVTSGIYKRVSLISNYSFVLGYNELLLEEAVTTTVNKQVFNSGTMENYANSKIASADFYYNLNIGNGFKFSYNSGLKNVQDLPDYEYIVTVPTGPFSTVAYRTVRQIQPSAYQLNWINRINLHYDIIKNAVMDINYMHTGMVKSWNETLRTIPKHKFTLIIQYDLPKRFTLWSRNYIQSATTWYNASGYHYDYMYEGSLFYSQPPVYSWELGITKKLFKEYLRLNFTVRSSLFHNQSNYEKGTDFQVPFSMSVFFNINGIGQPKTTTP